MAIGALHRLRAIPPERQPWVTGFDDVAWAQITDPSLTAVAVDAATIGAAPATVRLRRSCGCGEPIQVPSPGATASSVHSERAVPPRRRDNR